MRRMKRGNVLVTAAVGLLISLLLLASVALNMESFRNSYYEAIGDGNEAIARSIVNQLEDSLRYGKSLTNYYGIETFFEKIAQLDDTVEASYILSSDGALLYHSAASDGQRVDANTVEAMEQIALGEAVRWMEGSSQTLLLPIALPSEQYAAFGITYNLADVAETLSQYEGTLRHTTAVFVLGTLATFCVLMVMVPHGFQIRRLLWILVPLVVVSNGLLGLMTYHTFETGYRQIMVESVEQFQNKIAYDIDSVVSQGVRYSELVGIEDYYNQMLEDIMPIASVQFARDGTAVDQTEILWKQLPQDAAGQTMFMGVEPDVQYLQSHLRGILLDIVINISLSLLLAVEMLRFLLTLPSLQRPTAAAVIRDPERSVQPLDLARGLNFCFCLFQYMSLAFVSVVLLSIYRPIRLFSWEIPKELVLGLPMSMQILTSMVTSGLAGPLVSRWGWKPVTVGGTLVMTAGTALAACSREPYLFLLSQLIIGVGLGFSKTAFDVYSTLVASDGEMARYTANTNAAAIIGMSCASAIGGVLASSIGYEKTYWIIAVLGLLVAALFHGCGQNIVETVEAPSEPKPQQTPFWRMIDLRFASYLLFLVLPYSFIMEFVDYFFPVYANVQGITEDQVGYVLFVYGLLSAYLGTWLCDRFSQRHSSCSLIVVMMAVLCVGLGAFAMGQTVWLAILVVMLIALSDGIMPSQQFRYVYDLPTARRLGFTKALSMEGVIGGAIRGLAPMIFSALLAYGMDGLYGVAGTVAVCTALFLLVHRMGRNRNEVD